MNFTQLLGSLFVLAIPLTAIIVFIGILFFISTDIEKRNKSKAWFFFCLVFGNFGLSVYLFTTNRNVWGGFWLFIYPAILLGAFLYGVSFIENAGLSEE